MKRATLFILTAALLAGVSACTNDPAEPKADFFPTPPSASWRYVNTAIGPSLSEVWSIDTTTFRIEKDTVVDGKKYALLAEAGGHRKQGIRKENGNYYCLSFNAYNRQSEYVFLKDNLPVGSSWEVFSSDGYYKHVFTIAAKLPEKTIRGKAYRDVIEVQEVESVKTADGEYASPGMIRHCYAKNVGEVYAYYPMYSFGTYSDQELELLEYTPQ
jgi:hypothetical protein